MYQNTCPAGAAVTQLQITMTLKREREREMILLVFFFFAGAEIPLHNLYFIAYFAFSELKKKKKNRHELRTCEYQNEQEEMT